MFATLAFHWAGRENRFPNQLKDGTRRIRRRGLYYSTADYNLPGLPIIMPTATAVIEIGDYLQTKLAAFRAHGSQAICCHGLRRGCGRGALGRCFIWLHR